MWYVTDTEPQSPAQLLAELHPGHHHRTDPGTSLTVPAGLATADWESRLYLGQMVAEMIQGVTHIITHTMNPDESPVHVDVPLAEALRLAAEPAHAQPRERR